MKRPGRHLHLFPPSLPSSVSLQSRPAVIRLMEMNNIFAAQDCGAEGLSPVYRKGLGRAQRAVAAPLVQHWAVLYFSLFRLFHTLSPSRCLTGQRYAASLPPLSAHSWVQRWVSFPGFSLGSWCLCEKCTVLHIFCGCTENIHFSLWNLPVEKYILCKHLHALFHRYIYKWFTMQCTFRKGAMDF